MYSVSTNYHNSALACAKPQIRLKFNGSSTAIAEDNILSFTFDECMCARDNPTMGEAISSLLKIKLIKPTGVILVGSYFTLELGYNNEYVPCGKFYTSDITSDDNYETITIEAYDMMSRMTDEVPQTTTTVSSFINSVYSVYGVSCVSTIPSDIASMSITPTGTYRQMIGYIASLQGKNARINRDGSLQFLWYTSNGKSINGDYYYDAGFKRTSQSAYTIGMLKSGTTDNPIEVGSGRPMSFGNPYMTTSILTSILNGLSGFSWYSGRLEWIGDLAFEIGDFINVVDNNVSYSFAIMEQKFEYDGGLRCTIYSNGTSDVNLEISATDVLADKIDKQLTPVQRQVNNVENIMNTIDGANGGYFEILTDPQDSNRSYGTAWWKDLTRVNGWKFTEGGLGYYSNGVILHTSVCFDNNGNLNADYITAGTLDCSNITVSNLTADAITSGTLDCSRITVTNLVLYGNIYRTSSLGTEDFLIGINSSTPPNLQIGSAQQSSTSVYNDMNLYSNAEINFMVGGAKTSTNAKVIIGTTGAMTLKQVPSGTASTNAILCVNSNGVISNSGKTIADIGSGGTAVFG